MNIDKSAYKIWNLDRVKDELKRAGLQFRIRYRGPRKQGFHTVHGHTYWRDKPMCKQECLKKDATWFRVYIL
jgi:hypothetical protein